MFNQKKIAVIGAGHMGRALIGGMLRGKLTSPKNIVATRRDEEALAALRRQFGVHAVNDNAKAVAGADVVILAVKPQASKAVLGEIAAAARTEQLFISVMAGVTTATINALLKVSCPVVRAMPNTPCLVDAGATAICAGRHAGGAQLELAGAIFRSVGVCVVLPEQAMDAVTGLSGSGPVYLYMVIEAMIDGGVKMGLPRAVAATLAAQTVFGAAKLVIETGKHPAILKDEVTTPGGTAINAIHTLEARGLRSVLIDAVVTATQRSQELAKLYGD
ncbi:MAG: pyrroline-5-carboxylate reductase [Elusimicrobia bacterium]|nr:pyrroline-5-carboxylate reductase [Elusimicrobiota bacterium]MDE2237752.1 pyrroline-5-carboxylate reductase [Elusimicrobiota bacterium]MDE2425418.1 pyrroline-5-carboxylate reductase [Elusimicrobiota bacterium]